MLKFLDGYKNYIFALLIGLAGVLDAAFPDLQISCLGFNEPHEFYTAAVAWALGRNALAKVGK